jgi:hypothetical protein
MACEQVELASVPFASFIGNKKRNGELAVNSFVLRGYVRHWLQKVWAEYDRVKLCDVISKADPVATAAAAAREIAAPAAAPSRDAAFAPLSATAATPRIFVAKDDAGTRDTAARLQRQEPRVAESS